MHLTMTEAILQNFVPLCNTSSKNMKKIQVQKYEDTDSGLGLGKANKQCNEINSAVHANSAIHIL